MYRQYVVLEKESKVKNFNTPCIYSLSLTKRKKVMINILWNIYHACLTTGCMQLSFAFI